MPDTTQLEMLDPLITMCVATAFGVIVALLHLLAHRERPTYRLWRTLLLIAPLIAMATMAVGTNLAAAFTLFGTLAIVRFRTPIKEPLDAAFVIFSVVIGLATGNQSFLVATIGTLVIALTIIVLLAFNVGRNGTRAHLRLSLSQIDAPSKDWEAVLAEHAIRFRIEACTVDQAKNTQSLTLEVFGVKEEDWPTLLNRLMAIPCVERASGRPVEE
ncbi:MAG: DUF4956 domain-containing protein [Phycisphaerales bacterium]|nr:DUF4956 domain-containing protein [Phycisphaerales bacterium]